MGDLNTVVISGRLVREPIIRNASTGTLMGTFTIASNHCYKDKNGGFQKEAAFLPCVVFGQWTNALVSRQKGEVVLVSGRLRTESWEQDGERRTQLGMVCDSVRFFGPAPAVAPPLAESTAATQRPATTAEEKPDMPF